MQEMPITAFDLLVGGVLLFSVVAAVSRGFVRELLSLCSWIGALVIAYYAFPYLRPLVFDVVRKDLLADLTSAAGAFILPWILLRQCATAIGRRVSESAFADLDRGLAFVYGAVRGGFIICAAYVVVFFLLWRDASLPPWVATAWSKPYVEEGARVLSRLLPEGWVRGAAQEKQPGAQPARRGTGGYPDAANRRLEQLIRKVE